MKNIVINKIIIWGADDVNTLGLIRQIGKAKFDFVFLRKGKAKAASRSRYVENIYEYDSNEEALDYLVNTCKGEIYKPIIITTGDGISVFINQNKEKLDRYFIIPGSSIVGNIERYTDKNRMTSLAQEIGILCPTSKYIQWDSSLDGINYPCLIKPSHQKPGHYNEFKFRICNNDRELRSTISNVRHDSEFILQDYIKTKNEVVVVGARMWDGQTIIAGAIIRDRLTCGVSGHGLVTSQIPSCINTQKIAEYLEKIEYIGPFGFEYGLMDNKAYFYEVNLRNDGTTHCFYNAGSEIILAYIYSAVGLDYSTINTKVVKEQWFIDELYDFQNVLEGKISYKKWKQDSKEATIKRYYDESDLKPYNYLKNRKYIVILKYILLNKYRPMIVKVLDKIGLGK